jgi:surface polysaccharide O-acyltransferase-like enzyme
MEKMIKKKNSPFISILRIVAAFAVVMIHTRSFADHETPAYQFVYAAVLWSVPVFFMITGYIFFGIKKNVEFKDIAKNVLRFLAVLVVLGMFFSLSERVFTAGTFRIEMLGYALLDVVEGNLFDHMWYLYEIIGLYLLIPVFSAFLKDNNRNLYIMIGLLFGINFLIPDILALLGVSMRLRVNIGAYVLYLLLGAAMYRMDAKILRKLLIPSILVWALIVSLQAYMSFAQGKMIALSYVHSYVVLMSCSVFCTFKNLFDNEKFDCKFINELAGCTWGIYLFHPFIIHVFGKLFKFNIVSYNNLIAFPICCIVIFALSFLATFVLRKIPFVKRFL